MMEREMGIAATASVAERAIADIGVGDRGVHIELRFRDNQLLLGISG
jgi:hypothetical protein